LAAEFGVSRERVRQIDVSSLEKVRKAVKYRGATIETLRLQKTKQCGLRCNV
jgi:DNA-directed RNA polymerase sigma subunit (sigma70/sigma32)